jgi:hypothetical protein
MNGSLTGADTVFFFLLARELNDQDCILGSQAHQGLFCHPATLSFSGGKQAGTDLGNL